MSFLREISGGVMKCWLFIQVISCYAQCGYFQNSENYEHVKQDEEMQANYKTTI